MVDKQFPMQVVDLMLNNAGKTVFGIKGVRFAVKV